MVSRYADHKLAKKENMRLHQVTLRKGGPTHAVEYQGGSDYADSTICGAHISMLQNPIPRRFENAEHQCKRCLNSKVRA